VAFQYRFEWDPNKAVANRRKHGIGFEQAATVFRDRLALSIYDEDHSDDEDRWVTLGQAENGALLVVVHTWQETGATEAVIRIISARPATAHEQRDYEQTT
jgi:uncharacterized DUF497 family protein